jgi:hypothetical protein
MNLTLCSHCRGFLPPAHAATCPHCGADTAAPASASRSLATKALGVIGGGAVAVTLMACYGGAPQTYTPPNPPPPSTATASSSATPPPPPKMPNPG